LSGKESPKFLFIWRLLKPKLKPKRLKPILLSLRDYRRGIEASTSTPGRASMHALTQAQRPQLFRVSAAKARKCDNIKAVGPEFSSTAVIHQS